MLLSLANCSACCRKSSPLSFVGVFLRLCLPSVFEPSSLKFSSLAVRFTCVTEWKVAFWTCHRRGLGQVTDPKLRMEVWSPRLQRWSRTAEDAGLAAEAEVKTFTKTLRSHMANSEFSRFSRSLCYLCRQPRSDAWKPSADGTATILIVGGGGGGGGRSGGGRGESWRVQNHQRPQQAEPQSLKASKPQSLKASKPQSLKASKPQSLKATQSGFLSPKKRACRQAGAAAVWWRSRSIPKARN